MKTCSKCKIPKDESEYYLRPNNKLVSECKKCMIKRSKKYTNANKNKAKSSSKKWYKENSLEYNEQRRTDRKNPDIKRKLKESDLRSHYKRKYNITLEDYDKLFEAQSGVCAICAEPETSTFKGSVRRLCVDHDHNTGRVRGLLCSNCNAALGLFKDKLSSLSNAMQYLIGK